MLFWNGRDNVVYLTQPLDPLNRIKSIKGEEKFTNAGNLKQRRTKKKYGISYNKMVLNYLRGRTILPSTDKRRKRWIFIRLAPGESPITTKIGKPKKQKMGKCKHRPSRHKFQGINRIPFDDVVSNLR